MNSYQETNGTTITLEMISRQKAEKLTEIRASRQRMTEQVRKMFRPAEPADNAHALMNNFSSGIAIFNGVMTGFKIIKRIRSLFRRK